MANRRVLVMGATGRIGKVLRRFWPEEAAIWQARAPREGHVVADPLADPEGLARLAEGAGALLCLSGVVAGRGGNMADNVALGLAAVNAGARAGVPVLLASSAAVYGRGAGAMGEDSPLAPINPYGQAKAEMEAEAQALGARLGVPVTSLRIGNIAGLDAILGGWRAGFALDRFADGATPLRSYIGLATLARVLLALARDGAPAGALNLAQPGAIQMGALLDAAGLGWSPRAPGPEAIAEVVLDVARLAGYVALDKAEPEGLVREWREVMG